MRALKVLFFLLFFVTFAAMAEDGSKPIAPCGSKEACLTDPNCLCWCSQICNWRKKTPEDHPVYIENDKYGKFCYCKQWDYDNYVSNCIKGENIKQPKGSQ